VLQALLIYYAEQGLCNGTMSVRRNGLSVRPSVCPVRPPQQRAARLLLWARRIGDID